MRRIAALVLATLAAVALAFTFVAWDAMKAEEQLAHEVGDDTALFASAVLFYAVVTLLLASAALVTWRWQSIRAQWQAERQLMKEMRHARRP